MSQSDLVWVAPGDMPEVQAHAQLNELLKELGIDKDRMLADLKEGYAFRSQHHPTDEDSWVAGWFDALEWLRYSR